MEPRSSPLREPRTMLKRTRLALLVALVGLSAPAVAQTGYDLPVPRR